MALIDGLGAIGDAIREKNGTTELIPFKDMPQAILDISSGGAELEAIETAIDNSGVLDSTEGTATEKVKELIDYTDLAKRTRYLHFQNDKDIERIDVYIGAEFWSCAEMFRATPNLKFLKGVNTSKSSNVKWMFNGSGIEEIEVPFDLSTVTVGANNYFTQGARYLREIRIVPETIKCYCIIDSAVLSAESIQSIIDGLSPITTSQAIVLNTEVVAKLTDEQLITIANKNWTVG